MCNHEWIECGDEKICLLCGQAVKVDEPAPSVTETIFRQKNRPINQVLHGNCLEVLKTLEDNSVDSIVTDPPYELGFMGKKWDSTGIAYNVDLWKECLRVLKPGGHLLAFGGTRTYHRMVCAIEDAGFEIRDCIQWLYSTGFPKSHNISKAIDKKLGAEREKLGIAPTTRAKTDVDNQILNWGGHGKGKIHYVTKPATKQAEQWEGWGTALKPANEPIVLARKPLSEKTVADNVLKWGTGGLNIDGCRIGTEGGGTRCNKRDELGNCLGHPDRKGTAYGVTYHAKESEGVEGRFPANVILDEEAGQMLDEQSGITKSGKVKTDKEAYEGTSNTGFLRGKSTSQNQHGDTGGASRFFYCAKASKKERGEGNNHPTVKPIALMEYLIKLVTPPEGIVLDPFIGSGTTAIASLNTGRSFIGIEKEKKYFDIANERIANHTIQ